MKSSLCNKRYVHPTISRYSDIDLSLYLFLKKDRILYSICSLRDKTLVAYGDYTLPTLNIGFENALQQIFIEENLFSFSYFTTSFSILDAEYTLIPTSLCDDSHSQDYLNFVYSQHSSLTVKTDIQDEISVISSYHNSYLSILPSFFSNAKYLGFHALLLKYFQKIQQSNKRFSSLIFLWGGERNFDLCIFHQKELILFNTYPSKNQSEKLYYFLYACNQLKLDLGDTKLYLGGNSLDDSFLYENHVYEVKPIIYSPYFHTPEDGANYFFLDQSFII